MKNVPANCICCSRVTLHKQKFVVKGFGIFKCSECGLGSTKVNSKFNSKNIYDKSYFNGGQNDGYSNYMDSEEILKIEFNAIKKNILKFKPKLGGELLEIGCAYGFFLETVNSLFNISGIEMCDDAVNVCKEKGLNVFNADEKNFFTTFGIFDIVVMLDVIEHLIDPSETFQLISEHTKKDSLLVISTGDFGSFCSLLFGKYWRLMTPPQHLWFFNQKSIIKILKKYGFKVESISYPIKFVPLNLIIFQIARYFGLQKYFKSLNIKGGIPINLFDAMRIIARRV